MKILFIDDDLLLGQIIATALAEEGREVALCATFLVEIIDNEVTKRNKMKILFIDDDLLLGQIIATALAEEGYEVCYQNSLTAMVAVAEEVKPDVVVLDVEIGEADGIEAIPDLADCHGCSG